MTGWEGSDVLQKRQLALGKEQGGGIIIGLGRRHSNRDGEEAL